MVTLPYHLMTTHIVEREKRQALFSIMKLEANIHCLTCQEKGLMGTLHYDAMEVHVAVENLRQSLIAMIAPENTRKGITSLDIHKFIFIISMFLIMNVNHGIRKLVYDVIFQKNLFEFWIWITEIYTIKIKSIIF